MDIFELKEKTAVFEQPERLTPQPVHWLRGEVKRIFEKGEALPVGYILCAPFMDLTPDDLPIEFFNHQIADLDIQDEQAIFDFLSAWGFPFSPTLIDISLKAEAVGFGLYSQPEGVVAEWASLERPHISEQTKKAIKKACALGFKQTGWDDSAFYIGHAEAMEALVIVQDVRRALFAAIENDNAEQAEFFISEYLTAACAVPFGLPGNFDYANGHELNMRGFLTQAIANQIAETLQDTDTPWRKCKRCGRLFKIKQTTKKTNKARNDSIYCCDYCYEHRKREDRKRKKTDKAKPA